MKVVIDTNVMISALFWNGNPRKVVHLALNHHFQIFTTIDILKELQTVLTEDFHIQADKLKDIIKDILSYFQLIKAKPLQLKIRDLDDVKVVACALAAKADYVITGDKDLLILKSVDQVKIVTPADFLRVHFS